jgi:hypothetical protein
MAQIKTRLRAGYDEIKFKVKARQEKMMAIMKAGLEELKSVVEHEDVPKEEARAQSEHWRTDMGIGI